MLDQFTFCDAASLRVLFVTSKFPMESRAYIDNQIVGFIDTGIEVTVLATYLSDHADYALAKQYHFKDITFYKELPEQKREFDIVYCQFLSHGKKMVNLKRAGYVSGQIVACCRSGKELMKVKQQIDEYRLFFNEVDLILVVCEHFKDQLISYGCDPQKICVHHSAIETNNFDFKTRSYNGDALKIITIGTLKKMKGHLFVLGALIKLKKKYPQIIYTIIGDGSKNYLDSLNKTIIKNDLQDIVFLKGFCPHNDIKEHLYEHDMFILCSQTTKEGSFEGIPNVIMEAMATGMPVIGTYHGGIPELVEDGVSGFLVPENDSILLAEKIAYLIEHSELWESFGKVGRRKVLKEHNKDVQNQKVLELFRKMAKK